MWVEKPIDSIELLSDNKSFHLDSGVLWVLAHFGDLTITKQEIRYSKTLSHRSRVKEYPIRKMRRQFKTVSEFLDLFVYRCLNARSIKFTFENGWRVKVYGGTWIDVSTTSRKERDRIIKKLVASCGLKPFNISELKVNYDYSLSYSVGPREILPELDPSPDMFWSSEEREEWNKKAEVYFEMLGKS